MFEIKNPNFATSTSSLFAPPPKPARLVSYALSRSPASPWPLLPPLSNVGASGKSPWSGPGKAWSPDRRGATSGCKGSGGGGGGGGAPKEYIEDSGDADLRAEHQAILNTILLASPTGDECRVGSGGGAYARRPGWARGGWRAEGRPRA